MFSGSLEFKINLKFEKAELSHYFGPQNLNHA